MSRVVTLFALILLLVLSFGLYRLKYAAEDLYARADQLKLQYAADSTALKVLEAELAYLMRPDRLEGLAEKYLDLAPPSSRQTLTLSDLAAALPPLPQSEVLAVDDAQRIERFP